MEKTQNGILIINAGSSSIKFAMYYFDASLSEVFTGAINNIGSETSQLNFSFIGTNKKESLNVKAANIDIAGNFLIDWLIKQIYFTKINAIGHRIVHGMKHTLPETITPQLIEKLKQISSLDPDHLPGEIMLIELFQKRFPTIKQVACFDTAFHTTMPLVAKLLPIPRKFYDMGIQRYGFHGLSYSYLMEQLICTAGRAAANGKIILAHLGSGASITAVNKGKSIDTSMGFTPAGGLPMSTRSGDIDPGVAWFIMQQENLNTQQFNELINHRSGLIGIAETSGNMKELLIAQQADSRAAEAVELFCYQAKKYIGAYAAILNGIETLVFSGGIGERSPEIRRRICVGLQFLDLKLNEDKNQHNNTIISSDDSRVTVRVIETNEAWMMAKLVVDTLNL